MGCNRTVTAHDLQQILESTDILKEAQNPDAIDQGALTKAILNYGEGLISDLVSAYEGAPEYLNAILDSLNQIADIEGAEDLVWDLIAGGRKAQGAEFQLSYMLKHKGEIAAVSVPRAVQTKGGRWYGREGIDVLNKDGSVAELKSFDFTRPSYRNNAQARAEQVVQQARDRVEKLGAPRVTIVFTKWYGPMPQEFRSALDAAIGDDPRIDWRME